MEEETRTEKNMFAGCMTTLGGCVVFGILAIFSINVAMIFALILALIVMMILQ